MSLGVLRAQQTLDTTPAKKPSRTTCEDDPKTVVLQFGKGGRGKIWSVSWSYSLRRYMTKQQREVCDDDGSGNAESS